MAKNKLSIDMDSLNTKIYKSGYGMVLCEPTVASVDESKGEVKFIGQEAKKLIGKTSKGTKIVLPVFEGEIVNESVCASVLEGFLKKVEADKSMLTTALFAVPCGVTPEMIDKYKKVAKKAGLSKVYFAESPFLSALGQRAPLSESAPCFVIDMAGGVTNVAILSLNGIIAGVSVNIGSNKITSKIIDFVSEKFSLQIGLLTAEKLQKEIGSLDEFDELTTIVNGRDLNTGTPKSLVIKASDIFGVVKSVFDTIADIALSVLKKIPPEVSAEIRHSGVYLSGCGCEIYGLENYYKEIFKMNVTVAENPSMMVALGGGIALGDNEILKKVILKTK